MSADISASLSEADADNAVSTNAAVGTVATVVGVLPGLGDYTDSDHSDTSSSDSDIDTDLFRRDAQAKHGHDVNAASAGVKHRHHWVATGWLAAAVSLS